MVCLGLGGGSNLLHLADGLVQDLGLQLGVLEIGLDLLDHVSSELALLTLTDRSLVTDPRVQDSLDLGGQSSLLLELKGLCLEFGSLLGEGVKSLGDIDHILHLADLINTLLHSRLVILTGLLEDRANLVDVAICPLVEGLTGSLDNTSERGGEGKENQGLFIEDINLLGDQVRGGSGESGDIGSLGEQRVSRKRIDDALSLVLRRDLLLCYKNEGDMWTMMKERGRNQPSVALLICHGM